MTDLDAATKAAFQELVRQLPETVDCSEDMTKVLAFDAMNLRLIVSAALAASTPVDQPGDTKS